MSYPSTNRLWSIAWLILAVLVIPFLVARLFFDEDQLLAAIVTAIILGLAWLFFYGRVPEVPKETVVIRKGPGDQLDVFTKGQYPYMPLIHSIVAVLPNYRLTFELPVENIDTRTPNLGRISKITVRVACSIKDHAAFFRTSAAFLDRIIELEESTKLKRTDTALWRKLLKELAQSLIDDSVRDVVWKWQDLRASDPGLLTNLTFDSLKNSDDDPYGLSLNRVNLAQQVAIEVADRIARNGYGIALRPLVFESIEIDPEMIKRKTGNRDKDKEKAKHDASLLAAAIIEKGVAEAEVRATTLAKLLDVLINQYDIPHTDPLIAQVVRASLYSDGEMIWKGVLEKSTDGDGKAKAA
ncbi:MAG: hypothetical protein HGA45_16500 [Chloroflexales bacterium]|nr:hypothetical protein [Chloroflexales bacterium]